MATTFKPEDVTTLNKTVKVTFPKNSKDLKTLTAGMKMIGWSLATGTCAFFLDRAISDFDKLTKPVEKKPVKKAPAKKIEAKEDLTKK